jgi:hypothetical protein
MRNRCSFGVKLHGQAGALLVKTGYESHFHVTLGRAELGGGEGL